ncbi:uncharacterized protein ACR2FA_010601 [Aphomia sociella]
MSIETSSQTSIEEMKSLSYIPSQEISFQSSSYSHIVKNPLKKDWCDNDKRSVRPLNPFRNLDDTVFHSHRSLCSMNCIDMDINIKKLNGNKSPNVSLGSTNHEKQMHCTDLDWNSINTSKTGSYNNSKVNYSNNKSIVKRSFLLRNKVEPEPAYFFLSRKKQTLRDNTDSPMKKSKKCTNLVKYKNMNDEPRLSRPFSKCMLLGKYRLKVLQHSKFDRCNKGITCDVISQDNDVQMIKPKIEHKSLQDTITISEYDNITEKLMLSVFQMNRNNEEYSKDEIKSYVNQVVKELYDIKLNHNDKHPVKFLFRSLLEYWLKNTNGSNFNNAKNKNEKSKPLSHSPKRDTESFEKERRIQELERVLKNTVYICETVQSNQSKERDIKITKTLINNLEKLSKKSDVNKPMDNSSAEVSNSSTELPKIQDTINHLISETAIPPDVAKEFLNAYLNVLLNDSSKSFSTSSSSQSSDQIKTEKPICNVQTESVQKKFSKSVITGNKYSESMESIISQTNKLAKDKNESVDPGQQYLKDVLDKVTTIFSKVNNVGKNDNDTKTINNQDVIMKDELGRLVEEYPEKNIIYKNYDEKSVVINLSKYDLESISMCNDPSVKGIMSITIKLKEKPLNLGEINQKYLNLKFSNDTMPVLSHANTERWLHNSASNSCSVNNICEANHEDFKTLFDFNPNTQKDDELKPYLSTSDATSKACRRIAYESEHSLNLSFKSSKFFKNDIPESKCLEDNENHQSCYIMSAFKKNNLTAKYQSKKKVRLKESNEIILNHTKINSSIIQHNRYPESYFDKPTPKIIDEKFILLLLENLTLLARNLPGLHKDLNKLYMKLKKRHEKDFKNCSTLQGLSFLGKIYNEEFNKTSNNDTQSKNIGSNILLSKSMDNTDIATSTINLHSDNHWDKCLSANTFEKALHNCEVQTENDCNIDEKEKVVSETEPLEVKTYTTKTGLSEIRASNEHIMTVEQGCSNPNWYNLFTTNDFGVSTVIKCDLHKLQSHYLMNLKQDKEFSVSKKAKNARKQSPKTRQDLIKQITLMSPLFKVSTQSQTDSRWVHSVKDRKILNEFKIHQVTLGRHDLWKSNSENSLASVRDRSDDLKTIYRCTSEPSCCSG